MKALLKKIRQLLKDRRTRRFLTRFVSGIAAIVVFVTTYALVLPAITMESEANCGIEAHQHDDSCCSENLICGLEESEGHHHTEDCYTVTRDLICTIEEHQHSLENGCFAEDGSLICTLEEHTHDDSCYEENRELTCGLEETEGHHHTESCYEKVLTCGKEVHTHSEACYKVDPEIESAAVASAGVTSAAAEIEDDNAFDDSIVTKADEISEVSDSFTSGSDKAGREDESVAADADHDAFDADDKDAGDTDEDESDIDIIDAKGSADNSDKYADTHKDTGKEEEEAASSFSTGFAADEDVGNGDVYIPDKEALNFYTVLNKKTGIYYHHVEVDEVLEDSSAITDWTRADGDTELNPQDIIRVYLSYTLPKDTINATNDISRYRLPDTLHLTDGQIETINTCENGISAQYINYDNLEVTDPERHTVYLGLESVEGTRLPDEEPEDDSPEYISATVRAEKIYDEETGEYEGTDLIFTFSPYTVEKNAHAYDKKGQPTRAGEEVTGWLTLDFNMGQIDWSEDNTSEIIFAEEDEENDISEISTVLKRADESEAEANDTAADGNTEAAAEDMTADTAAEAAAENMTADAAATDAAAEAADEDATAELTAADNTSEKAEEADTENGVDEADEDLKDEKETKGEITAANYPAAVFDDSITVRSGRLDTDLDDTDIPKKTKMTVHVEADEGTFPEGTKMVLSAVEDINAVAEAVCTAIDAKTRGFQAVDITFYDKDPSEEDAKEIEPLKPIRVSIKSDEIRKAAEDSSTAPVVVHIEDDNTATALENTSSKTDSSTIEVEKAGTETDSSNTEDENAAGEKDGKKENSDQEPEKTGHETDNTAPENDKTNVSDTEQETENFNPETDKENNNDSISNSEDNGDQTSDSETEFQEEDIPEAAISETVETPGSENAEKYESEDGKDTENETVDDTVRFNADSFSIYAVVYTVELYTQVISANGKTYDITVYCGEDAQIPEGSELKVTEILPSDERYSDLYDEGVEVGSAEAQKQGIDMPRVSDTRLFDIEIQGPERKVEPAAPVKVEIHVVGMPTAEYMSVVHFAKDGAETMELQKVRQQEAEAATSGAKSDEADEQDSEGQEEVTTEVSFLAASFSVYMITGYDSTVDLENDGPFVLVSQNGPNMYTADNTYNSNVLKYAITSDLVDIDSTHQTLTGKSVYQHTGSSANENYVGGNVTEWYFERGADDNQGRARYYIYTKDSNGNRKYIHSGGASNFDLATSPDVDCLFRVEESGGKIRLRIQYGDWSMQNDRGTGDSQYGSTSRLVARDSTYEDQGRYSYLFTLAKHNPDYDEKVAKKVSAADYNAGSGTAGNWNAGSTVVIYRRVLHDDGSELLYVLANDGTWVSAYDGGDSIYYHCPEGKDVRWTVRHEDDGYHITSKDGTVSLAPSKTNNAWSVAGDEGVGLTMHGIGSEYGSQIEVWDQRAYAYAGLHLPLNDDGALDSLTDKVQPGIEDDSDKFLFAIIPEESLITQGTVHNDVATVDTDSMGITIKMFDYTDTAGTYNGRYRQHFMQHVLGDDMLGNWASPNGGHKYRVTKMVNPTLNAAGYPVSTSQGWDLAWLFDGSIDNGVHAYTHTYNQTQPYTSGTGTVTEKRANNLFLKSYYDENGMFRYSSMENFAYLQTTPSGQTASDGTALYDFTVYREAGTPNIPNNNDQYYYYHGHFMPYNDLDPTQDISRIVNQYGYLENIDSGRVYDDLYGIKGTADYYFGMTMEAQFVQPEGGTLANGDPVVYKFTGDDDLWVFIDGVLVLDVSGIHEALTGTINFETGIVEQPYYYGEAGSDANGQHPHHTKTLYDIFMKVRDDTSTSAEMRAKIDAIEWNEEKTTFADYTTHSFNMFYLERGAGASNLDLQFNLQVVKTNEFTVEKKLPEGVDTRFINQKYRYRATYLDEHTNEEKPLYFFTDDNGDTFASTDSQGHVVCTKVIYKDRKDAQGRPIEVPVPINDQGYFELKPGEGAVFTMTNQHTVYNVREVGIDTNYVSQVDINNQNNVEIKNNSTYNNYAEAGEARVEDRSNVIYRNHPYVQNLRITKHITDDSLEYDPNDPPVFEFRVYLETTQTITNQDGTTEEVHKLIPYSYGPYYLVTFPEDAENDESQWTYYKLTGENNKPVPQTGKVICSETGRSGSINSIPPDFTIIIPNLGLGTHFYVEERRDNIPGGYEFDHEELQEGTYDDPSIEHIERIIARDEEDHQEFDPSTVGRIKVGQNGQSVDAWSHIYNRRPAIDVPVEKKWNPEIDPGDPAPDPVTVALVRYKGPEHEHKPVYGKGAIHINHRYALYVDGDNETTGAMPNDFVAEYTILDEDNSVVVEPTISTGPFDLNPGTYTVQTNYIRPTSYNGYEYDSTPDMTEVTVTADKTTEIEIQSRFVNPDLEKGRITIEHVFDGWQSTSGQSSPFQAFYVILNANDEAVLYTETPGTYPVDPGTYTVLMGSKNESYDVYGYTCLDNPYSEKTQTVTVGNLETKTVTFTNTYESNQTQQGTITITHTSSGLPGTTALPNGFQATYTIKKGNVVVQDNAQLNVQYPVEPGVYTVTANVTDAAAPNGYTHTNTASVTVGVNNGENVTASLVSNYSQQTVQGGYITISHTSSGLPDTSALPNGFQATYTITDANGLVVQSNAQRDVSYPVAPGNYSVSVNVSNGAAPSAEYLYANTTPNPANVTVTSGNTATASFVSTYQPARVTTVYLCVAYSPDAPANMSNSLTVPINSTINLKYHGYSRQDWGGAQQNPNWQLRSWNQSRNWWNDNAIFSGGVPSAQGVDIQLGDEQVYCVWIETDPDYAGMTEASITLKQTTSSLQQPRNSFAFNPFTITAYADEVSDKAAAGTASFSADVRQKAYQSPDAETPIGYTSDSGISQSRGIDEDEEPVLRDGPDNGETDIAPLSMAVQQKVYQAVGGSSVPAGYSLDTDFGKSFELNGSNNWEHIFNDLEELDEYGNVYYYALVELNVPEDYTVDYADNPMSAQQIRENKEAQDDDNPPELLKLTATNMKKTGNLKLVKAIAPGSNVDTTVRFHFKVTLNGADPSRLLLDGEEIPAANISTDENGVTTIYLEFIGKGVQTLSGILMGTTYEVVELDETGHAMPDNWQKKGNVVITSDLEGGTIKTIEADETETATITNEETGPVEATKTWAPQNPNNITIYFKLFYQRTVTPEEGDPYVETKEVPGQRMKEIPPSEDETINVTWEDLPKYMDDGNPYTYVVKEYIQKDDGEYLDPYTNLHYTEAAPDGYVKVENGLSITNTKSEEYNPKTNYTGTKTWVDTNKTVRPDSLRLTLMIDDGDGIFVNDPDDQVATYLDNNGDPVEYEAQWTQGEGELADQWFYTFRGLPVFDEEGKAIEYYVIESPVGYSQTSNHIEAKEYIRLTTKYLEHVAANDGTDRNRTLTLQYETDLPFVAIMSRNNATQYNTQEHTYLHHVWTPRQLTDNEERLAVLNAINAEPTISNNDRATLQNTRFVTGQPTGDPAAEVEGHPGRHKVDFMYRDNTANNGYRVEIHQSDDKTFELSFFNRTQFDNICFGYLNYSYTHGETDFTNTQVLTTFDALKTWGDDAPPEGTVIKLVLKAETSERVFENLADELGIDADYQTITLNGKSDVETVTDSTTQELLTDTENTVKSYEVENWRAYWTDLPEYDNHGKKIHYSVKEIEYKIGSTTVNIGEDGFPPTYTEGTESSPYTVTNQIPKTQKSAKKLWDESQGETLPDGVKVTLTLSAKYKEGGASIDLDQLNISPASVELDGIVSEDADEPETARTLWAYTWNNLPEYYNGKEVEYTVAETGYTINGVSYPVVNPEETAPAGYSNFDYVFKNSLPTVKVNATKIWKNHEGEDITNTINNVEAWFELQEYTQIQTQTGEEQWQWVAVSKNALGENIDNPVKRDGSENPKWKAFWTDLPKYKNGEKIQYRVKETYVWIETDSQSGAIAMTPANPVEVIFPFEIDPDTNTGSAGTTESNTEADELNTGTADIINQLPPINVAVNKLWGKAGSDWLDARISVRMKLMQENAQGEVVPLPDHIVQYTDPTGELGLYAYVALTDLHSKEWDNLPMYYDNGDLIKYRVIEDGVFFTSENGDTIEINNIEDFYDSETTDWTDSNGHRFFTINNKPKETDIYVTKVWTMNGDPRTDKTAIGYKLYRKYGETTEEVVLSGIQDNVTVDTGEVTLNQIKYNSTGESGTWQNIKIAKLPMFQMNVDPTADPPVFFAPITYYVEEDSTSSELATGTVTSYSGNGAAETSTAAEAAVNTGSITIYNRDDFNINLVKIDEATKEDAQPTALPDAVFQLKRYVESLAANDSNDPYETVGSPKTTDEEGRLFFSGVGFGKYKIVEMVPPPGFVKTSNDEDVYFIINNDGSLTWTDKDYHPIEYDSENPPDPLPERPERISYNGTTITFTVGNAAGAALPNSGGSGTNLFYLIGCILTMLAGAGILMKRRRREEM